MGSSEILGTEKVNKLIFNLGWPAALNFLVVSIYNLTDVVFVGKWLGSMHIAAVVVVGTITFLFSSFGLAIGIGGAAIIARALGEKNKEKAASVFRNQNLLVIACSFIIVLIGWVFEDFILKLFGANGEIFPLASDYYRILLFGVPFLSWSMMGNNIIHTEGKAKVAMLNSLIPTVLNIILNPVFILGFHMGIEGAAWATLAGYVLGFLMVLYFFTTNKSEIKLNGSYLNYNLKLIREIGEIGGSVLVNIFTTNLFVVILNQSLYQYEREAGVVIYGIINRINNLFLIIIIGIDGGIRPIIGYNLGSQRLDRIKEALNSGLRYGLIISYALLAIVFLSADYFIHLFTNDSHIITMTPFAMKVVFSFFPLLIVQTITTAYFQAISKPQVSFYLTLIRNIFLLVPLLYILPRFFGYYGILYTFPIVDILTTIPAALLLKNELSFKMTQRLGLS